MIKVYNLIGLARKAGRVSSGAQAVERSLGSGTARLLILSDDVSANTRSALVAICSKRSVPYCTLGDKERLGASVGQAYRVALTIDDRGLARAILDAVREDNTVEVVEWPK